MMLHSHSRRFTVLAALATAAFAGASVHAQTSHTWAFTAAGNSYNWNDPNSWFPSEGFPDSFGAVANIDIDIAGAQTINLQEAITVGRLNLGDADGSHSFTIANGSGSLTFDSGDLNIAARLVMSSGTAGGTAGNTLNASIALGSNLQIDLGTSARALTISGTGSLQTGIGAQSRTLEITGGTSATNQFTVNGDVSGQGLITNNSNAAMIFNGAKTFTGTFVLNRGSGGSNTGSLTVTNGSIADASEVIINGYLTNGTTQNGGSLHSGNGSGQSVNPGQRLTRNRITLNGGSLNAVGQTLSGGAIGTLVEDNVATIALGKGFNVISMSRGGNSSGTLLDVGTLERSAGATLYVRSQTLGLAVDGSQFLAENLPSSLVGVGGPEGSATMSIVPWIVANNGSASTSIPTGFATYTSTGVRALNTATEYVASITAGGEFNVSVGSFGALSGPTMVNSLRLSGSGGTAVSTIGAGQTLTVASGGIFLASNGTTIGAAGNPNAGTLNFGEEEGVVWSNGTNLNTIGASITGSGGLIKSGTGTLILAGVANEYSGPTYVGGGILQIGDGTNASNLGFSDAVTIAAGSQLTLTAGNMIQDSAVLRLEQYGLFNGKVTLFAEVNETVGALFLGDMEMPAGTYGPMGTNADFESDQWFGGLGVITVVPEPGSAALLLGGIAMLVSRRRRG